MLLGVEDFRLIQNFYKDHINLSVCLIVKYKSKSFAIFPKGEAEEMLSSLAPRISSSVLLSRVTLVILFIKVLKHSHLFEQDDLQVQTNYCPSCEVTCGHFFMNL